VIILIYYYVIILYADVTFKALDDFIRNLFSMVRVECFMHGNMSKLETIEIRELMEAKLRAKSFIMMPYKLSERQIEMKQSKCVQLM